MGKVRIEKYVYFLNVSILSIFLKGFSVYFQMYTKICASIYSKLFTIVCGLAWNYFMVAPPVKYVECPMIFSIF